MVFKFKNNLSTLIESSSSNFALSLSAKLSGGEPTPEMQDYPRVDEGVRGMAFIDNVVASGKAEQKWTDFVV